MTGSADKKAHRQHPHNDEHMVTSSAYYRNRADVDRGLKKRDMPSADIPTVSEKEREEIADAKIAPSNP
jgi:hypothetical protein